LRYSADADFMSCQGALPRSRASWDNLVLANPVDHTVAKLQLLWWWEL